MLPLPGFNARWHRTKKTNLQREKYKAITPNVQNFRQTTGMNDYYNFYTLHILTFISMKEK